MPVLIVSLNTSPHEGFSRKRVILPSCIHDHDAELQGIRYAREHYRGIRALLLMKAYRRFEIEIGEHVAADDDDTVLPDFLQRIAHAAGGAVIRFRLHVLHGNTVFLSSPKNFPDRGRMVEEQRDDLPETMLFQQVNDVQHHGPVDHGHHRFGNVAGKRGAVGSRTRLP
jgi:hypothetical protein